MWPKLLAISHISLHLPSPSPLGSASLHFAIKEQCKYHHFQCSSKKYTDWTACFLSSLLPLLMSHLNICPKCSLSQHFTPCFCACRVPPECFHAYFEWSPKPGKSTCFSIWQSLNVKVESSTWHFDFSREIFSTLAPSSTCWYLWKMIKSF